MPNAVYEPRACIRLDLGGGREADRISSVERIIFEFTENEKLDADHVLNILQDL